MDQKRKQQIIIKICCLVASFCLWLYISNIQNPIKTYKLKNVSVQLINTDAIAQSKLTVLAQQEYTVTLTIKGMSNDVYLAKPEQFKVVADLSGYAVKKGENRIPIEVKESPSSLSILNSEMLWIKVNLDDLVEKTVPVKVELGGKAKDGFVSSAPISKPTDVLISGAAQHVNAVKYALAKGDIKNAEKDTILTLPLKAFDGGDRAIEEVKIQPTVSEIVVPIKKIKTVGLIVKTSGKLSKDLILKSIVPTVEKIDIVGSVDALAPITTLETEPIDLNSINVKNINNTTLELKIIVPKDVTLSTGNGVVTVKLSLDKVIQKNITLDLQVKGTGENLVATGEVQKISVAISGSESSVNAIRTEDIGCFVDLKTLEEGEHVLVPSVQVPEGITLVSVNPQNVKFIIKKKG